MKSNHDLQLVTEYAEKFFDYENFISRLSDQLASRKISNADVDAEVQKYCRIHKGCDPELVLDDINTNAYYKIDYQNDVLRAGLKQLNSIRGSSTMGNAKGGVTDEVWNQLNRVYDELNKLVNLLGMEYDIDTNSYTFNPDQVDPEWCDDELLDSIDTLYGDLNYFLGKPF